MTANASSIAVFGASGLIGGAITDYLSRAGFAVVPIARRLGPARTRAVGARAVEGPFVDYEVSALRALLDAHGVDVVVNCVGVLQDGVHGLTETVHRGFVSRLIDAMRGRPGGGLLMHLSIPGQPDADKTPFSRTKRDAERLIEASGLPFVILRPGFVIASGAYGGSALVRALAAMPFDLPQRESTSPFATTAMTDIGRTAVTIIERWRSGDRRWNAVWDVMEREPATVGEVVASFRDWIGGPSPLMRLPAWLTTVGALAGDLVARLGWRPPLRSTALHEMRRGVIGDPTTWIAATGLEPASCKDTLARLDPCIQERWFGRLYLLKPLVLGSLSAFWIVSGLVSLLPAFDAAAAILIDHGIPPAPAQALTTVTSLVDIGIGLAIAFRSTCRRGLLTGLAFALAYMGAATVLTPELWFDPLGALVKPWPAIVLTLAALAILEDR